MSLKQNLLWAETAIAHTHKMLPEGVANPIIDTQHTSTNAFIKLLHARYNADAIGQSTSAITAAAKWEGAGNCGEMARIALKKLKTLGASPIHIMYIPKIILKEGDTINKIALKKEDEGTINHAFLVIGGHNLSSLNSSSDGSNCNQWGEEAVICDPWISVACAASKADIKYWKAYSQNAWYLQEEQEIANLPARLAEYPV